METLLRGQLVTVIEDSFTPADAAEGSAPIAYASGWVLGSNRRGEPVLNKFSIPAALREVARGLKAGSAVRVVCDAFQGDHGMKLKAVEISAA